MAHLPVMYNECIDGLDIKSDGTYLDMTVGGFGHGLGICKKLSEKGIYVGFDLDEEALERAEALSDGLKCKVYLIHANFHDFKAKLEELNIQGIDGCLMDLGVSSFQIDDPNRGFSYMYDGPLDMRMDKQGALSAYEVINTYSEEELKKILFEYGEERFSSRIAGGICKRRSVTPIQTTAELVETIKSSLPTKVLYSGKNPASRTFQAVRIEVNGELTGLMETTLDIIDRLKEGGRVCVISFHSLEDRAVKQAFAEMAKGCICPKEIPVCVCGRSPKIKIITRSPIVPSEEEVKNNIRSRSAKLRIAQKL